MQVFDASSMIYAWDNYPIHQFPGLWDWMATEIEKKKLVIPSVGFDEVECKTPDCGKWLQKTNIKQIEITNTIIQSALHIKRLLCIKDDGYHPKGVGENDIIIIATAYDHKAGLVSNEGKQKRPEILAKQKIPAVCAMKGVDVLCINFLEFIKRSNAIFR
jgi:predicted nucleic acid-binding protein